MGKKAKKVKQKGKKEKKPRPKSEKWKKYSVKGDKVERTQSFCPKCGPGIFMAKHGKRSQCGKCGYTVFE